MATSSPNTINLMATKTGLSPQVELIERSLQKASVIAVIVFLVTGLSVGGLYVLYTSQMNGLEQTRTELRSQINAAKNNEGLLVSIKDRTRIVEKAMGSQRPWGKILDLLGTVAVPPSLSTVSIGDENTIDISLQGTSIDEIAVPINVLIGYAKEGRIKNPKLTSVQFGKDGQVNVSVTFLAVF
jgi:hypothetical protein